MLTLLKIFLQKLDFVAIAEFLRKRNNRRAAARLHLVLVQSYEIIELFEIILDELRAALESHRQTDSAHRFFINPDRIATLLQRQASNLNLMEFLTIDLLSEIQILDTRFEQAFRALFPHKFGILWEAQTLLSSARFPLNEDGVETFPAARDGVYRTVWFTSEAPTENRNDVEKFLYGWTGTPKEVVDINLRDGDAFFRLLDWYFTSNNPYERLNELKTLTECYKQALISNFSLEEILSDIGSISRHSNWSKQ